MFVFPIDCPGNNNVYGYYRKAESGTFCHFIVHQISNEEIRTMSKNAIMEMYFIPTLMEISM